MGWRIVKQPNGLLARFSDIVDDFTDMDMTEAEAIKVCLENMSLHDAEIKVKAGLEDWKPWTSGKRGSGLDRWNDCIRKVKCIHGDGIAQERVEVGSHKVALKYDVIMADPPWHFKNYSADEPGKIHNRERGANKHYPTMLTSDIGNLPIAELAAENAVLFMWACWPLLEDAIQVMKDWGFEYKTLAWVWVKSNPTGFGHFMGQGYYTRSNSEPCLLATRGRSPKPANRSILSVIYSPVLEHSRKPGDQYRKIEALYPDANYLELFARRKRRGWASWGNQVECDVSIAAWERK